MTERPDAVTSLVRSVIATGSRVFDDNLPPADFLKRRSWSDDRVAALITRGAAAPAMTTTAGWAQELGHVSQQFLKTLVPMSAAAQLLDACVALSFGREAKISLPNVAPGSATWVAEGAPIRVLTVPSVVGQTLTPSKLASIVELSREMMESSNIEAIVRQALVDSTAPALDAYLFDNVAAAPGLRPAGILNGVTPIVASTATSKVEAMDDDVAALVAAIAARAGNGSIAFVMSPPQATRMLLRAEATPGPVLMSAALAAGTAIAIATNGLVAALEPVAIDSARSSVLHRETAPAEIVAGGSPAAVATPTSSLFQTDCVALRLRLPVTWAVRQAGVVAVVTGVKW